MKKKLFVLPLLAISMATMSVHATPIESEDACGTQLQIEAEPLTGYHFVRWQDNNTDNPRTIEVKGDVDYIAYFAPNKYKIVFQNYDSTSLKTDTVEYGQKPSYGGTTPTKPSTAKYTYSFSAWSPTIAEATADQTYTAVFDSTLRQYNITFKNYNGDILQNTPVNYGDTPVYSGTTPTKPATIYTYTFKGWSPAIVAVTGETIYVADFDSVLNRYLITYKNDNGDILFQDSVLYGQTPTYGGTTPTKDSTAQYAYTFKAWSPTETAVTGDATYTATYNSTTNSYIITVEGENGTTTGAGTYTYGTIVTLTATPNDCYKFTKWNDENTQASRSITVTGDATYTATFDVLKYKTTIKSDNETQGKVKMSKVNP